MGGLRYVTGFPDRPPVRPNLSIGDALAALHGVIGVLMALRHRETNGGKGQVVDVALYEAVFNMMEGALPNTTCSRSCANAPEATSPASFRRTPISLATGSTL